MSERDDLEVERGPRSEQEAERAEEREDDRCQQRRLSENVYNLKRCNAYDVLGNHRRRTTGEPNWGDVKNPLTDETLYPIMR